MGAVIPTEKPDLQTMKNRFFLHILAALTAPLLLSCTVSSDFQEGRERFLPESAPDSISFMAYIQKGDSTRTALDGEHILWCKGDRIKVFNAATPEGKTFTLVSGQGSQSGVFSGEDPGEGPFLAIYPADAVVSANPSAASFRIALPAVQTYAADSFGPGANVAAGKSDQLDGITFQNVLGALSLTLKGEGKKVRSIRIRTNGSEVLCGTATLSLATADDPVLTFDAEQSEANPEQVSLDCGESGVDLTADGTLFFLSLPPGALVQGFTLEVTDPEGNAMIRRGSASANNQINRSRVRPMPALSFSPQYKDTYLTSEGVRSGAFVHALAGEEEPEACCEYEEAKSQFAHLETAGEDGVRRLRIQDWEQGFALTLTLPATIQTGKTCLVSIDAVGNTGSIRSGKDIPMTVVKQEDGRIWLTDPATGNGYVIMTED